MNEFQSTISGQGLLKTDYDETPVSQALRKRRKNLEKDVIVPTQNEVNAISDAL